MKKARNYCGLLFGTGVISIVIGVFHLVVYNVSILDIFKYLEGIKVSLFLIIGTVFLFLSYIINRIIDNIEEQLLELKDRTLDLDIKINDQNRK